MDFSSSLRRKQSGVTYSRRNRQQATGRTASSSAAPHPRAAAAAARSDGSSDGSSDEDDHHPQAESQPNLASSSARSTGSRSSPSKQSARDTSAPSPSRRSSVAASSALPITPGAIVAKPPTPSSTAARSSSSSLPRRPPRAASPSASQQRRTSTSTSTLPAKRSASSSPRKSAAASASPSKRIARSRTPTRPAQDLSSLFDAIQPTLLQPRSPFARSESHPVVHISPFAAAPAPSLTRKADVDSPLQSPTLPSSGLYGFDQLSPGTAPTSPSKRSRMADRMAPRVARPAKSKFDQISESLSGSRRGSLRRVETAPSAIFDAHSPRLAGSDAEQPGSPLDPDIQPSPARPSEAGSSSALPEQNSQTDSQSQSTSASVAGARRLAGIKQSSATNARRTYGLQRSFLADQAEDNLLTDTPRSPAATPIPDEASRNIEDEIEAQLDGDALRPSTKSARTKPSSAAHRSEANAPAPRESYAELLKKWGEGADDIEWDESQDPTLNLKSITSLRSTGELRRFNDDLEYLFSGLDPAQNLSIRKSSAVELVRLLCGKPDTGALPDDDDSDADDDAVEDPLASAQSADFLRKLKASDLIVRLFDLFAGAEAGDGVDDVLDASLVVYVAKLLKSPSSAEPLVRERSGQLHRTLARMLDRAGRTSRQERKDGFAALRLHDLKQHKFAARSDRKALDELRAIARISRLFVAGATNWTLRNLVLAACCSLIALPRRLWTEDALDELFAGEASVEDGGPSSLFDMVRQSLVGEGNKAQQRLVDFAKGLELVTPAAIESIPDLDAVDVSIRFLDKAMDVLYLELDRNLPASDETLDALQHLIAFALQAAPLSSDHASEKQRGKGSAYVRGMETRALQVLHGLFKMLLDLSQVDANWSESLASSVGLQTSVVRAFLLSHQSASTLRGVSVSKGDEETNGGGGRRAPEVVLFDDVVHLSLALLTNVLIKQLDKARETLAAARLAPTCWRRRPCVAETCVCEPQLPAIQLLARVFYETRNTAATRDDSNAAYLSNSIATALAQFAIGGPQPFAECRRALEAELPDALAGQDGLQTLLDAVDEFALVHAAALEASRDGEKDDEVGEVEEAKASPVANEAGQLIKDLAQALRQMA